MSDEFDKNREITCGDYCHFNPSKWSHMRYRNDDYTMMTKNVARNKCWQCIYNPNRDWKDSHCDYPKEYPDD